MLPSSAHCAPRSIALLILALACGPLAQADPSPLLDVVQVALGRSHTCARTAQGSVLCWGANERGQLGAGDDALTTRTTAVEVRGLGGRAVFIAAGDFHTCAALESGRVQCWGWNVFGQLGNGQTSFTGATVAEDVVGLENVVALSGGIVHTCALTSQGAVHCWGANGSGQLGDGSTSDRSTPTLVSGLGSGVSNIAAGGEHSCAALGAGGMRCWGSNEFGQLGDGTNTNRPLPTAPSGPSLAVSRIAAAARTTCAVTTSGSVSCWGATILESDTEGGGSLVPRPVPGLEQGVVDISAGTFHFCTLTGAGAIRCFGSNASGQFGAGSVFDSFAVEDTVGADPDITTIGAGGDHVCAVNARGGLQCWGLNTDGQLGIGKTSERLVPTQVSGLDNGTQFVGAGSFHSCALTSAGGVKCWGFGGQSQLGDGTETSHLTPEDVVGLGSGVRQLAVGFDHACAITADRRLRCWGANFSSQLGNGQSGNSAVPSDVVGLDGAAVIGVSLGREHGCALLEGGAVRCWGGNDSGQVGDGTTTQQPTAVPVVGLGGGVKSIAAGMYHTCAVTASDGAKCWGFNGNGQLGNGNMVDQLTPVDVVGLTSSVSRIGAGIFHTCAVTTVGAVHCWGGTQFGALLGDGSEVDRPVPGPVPALTSGVVEITLGAYVSCVRTGSGSMQCWGTNNGGGLGDNSEQTRPEPVQVAGLTRDVSAIDAGFGGQTCAVVAGAAKCWGSNQFGQLGDGSQFGVPSPQTVLFDGAQRRVAALAEANAASPNPVQLDGSGRYVLITSDADDLVPGDGNGATDVFLFDRELRFATRVSVDDEEGQIEGPSTSPSMTADARLVVFVAPDAAVTKVRGESSAKARARRKGGGTSVYLRNMLTGTTQQVASTSSASPYPQISANGSSVVFTAPVIDDAEGTVGQDNVFVVALSAVGDEVQPADPVCVSCKPNTANGAPGAANADGPSGEAVVSADGAWIAYSTEAKNGVADQSTPCPQAGSEIMLRNMLTGTLQRVAPPPGTTTGQCGSLGSSVPSIDARGTLIAWQTDQPLDGDDANAMVDVYAVNVGETAVRRVSVGAGGVDGNGASTQPRVSGDGSQITFVSAASNLDTRFADNNDRADVHSTSLDAPPVRLSLSATGAEANAASAAPVLNFDGSQVAFISAASLLTGQVGGPTAVLTRDNPQAPGKRSSTWWRASESGWGLTVFDQGSVLTPTWFTYDSDGEPSWFLVAGAFRQTDGTYTGEVYRFTGTPLLQIDGQAAQTVTLAGTATLSYVGEDLLHFNYTVDGFSQRKTLRKFPFGTRSFSCTTSPTASRAAATNYTDLWSGAAIDAGWGLTLFHVDDLLVAIWYTYDTDGEAVFFVITTNRQPDGSYSGDIFRQRNGVPFSDIDDALSSPGSDVVGTARFDFTSGEFANFSYTLGGVSQTRGIRRLVVGDAPHVCRSADLEGD